jgi:hypothetical protein
MEGHKVGRDPPTLLGLVIARQSLRLSLILSSRPPTYGEANSPKYGCRSKTASRVHLVRDEATLDKFCLDTPELYRVPKIVTHEYKAFQEFVGTSRRFRYSGRFGENAAIVIMYNLRHRRRLPPFSRRPNPTQPRYTLTAPRRLATPSLDSS